MKPLDETYEPVVIEDGDDIGSNRSTNEPLLELARARMSRRTALKGFVTTAVMGALGGTLTSRVALAASSFGFTSLAQTITEDMQVAPGYTPQLLIRWGDPVLPGAPAFDPMNQTADAQAKQFGYNNDFLGYYPLPRGSDSSEHGLLAVNFEYTSHELMFPGWTKLEAAEGVEEKERAERDRRGEPRGADARADRDRDHGARRRRDRGDQGERPVARGRRQPVRAPHHRRDRDDVRRPGRRPRPAQDQRRPDRHQGAGHAQQLRRRQDPLGHLAHRPRRTSTATSAAALPRAARSPRATSATASRAAGMPGLASVDRFDVAKEPNEPHRFGWMVEIDPYDPNSTPVKRTALGRIKHEGATTIVNKDGRLVAYTGDDERFEYLYKYVSNGTFDPAAGSGQRRAARRRHALRREVRRGQGDLAAAGPWPGSADRGERLRRARPRS